MTALDAESTEGANIEPIEDQREVGVDRNEPPAENEAVAYLLERRPDRHSIVQRVLTIGIGGMALLATTIVIVYSSIENSTSEVSLDAILLVSSLTLLALLAGGYIPRWNSSNHKTITIYLPIVHADINVGKILHSIIAGSLVLTPIISIYFVILVNDQRAYYLFSKISITFAVFCFFWVSICFIVSFTLSYYFYIETTEGGS